MKRRRDNILFSLLIFMGIILIVFEGCSSSSSKNEAVNKKSVEKSTSNTETNQSSESTNNPTDSTASTIMVGNTKDDSIVQATYDSCGKNSIYCTLSDGSKYEVVLSATEAFDQLTFQNFINKQLKHGQTVYLEKTDNSESNVLERNVWLTKPTKNSYGTTTEGNIDTSTAHDGLLQALLVENGISSVVKDRNNYQDYLYDLETKAMKNKVGNYAAWNSNNLDNEIKMRNGN